MSITIKAIANTDLITAWSAWVTPEDINHWHLTSGKAHSTIIHNDLHVGGRFSLPMKTNSGKNGFNVEGTYTKVIENNCIEYILDDDRLVSVEFFPLANGVKIIETFELENEMPEDAQRQGRQNILDQFVSYVETKCKR